MNTIGFIETLWQDVRFGARLLRLNPGFAVVAIASLALGIGANTAIFQLIDAVRLRTLPVKSPQELAEVKLSKGEGYGGVMEGWHPEMTNPLWEQVREHQQAFSGMLAWEMDTFNLARGGQAHNVPGLWVSGDFFNVLGAPLSWAACSRPKTTARVADRLLQSLVMRFGSANSGGSFGNRQEDYAGRLSGRSDRRHARKFLRPGNGSELRCGAAALRPGDS